MQLSDCPQIQFPEFVIEHSSIYNLKEISRCFRIQEEKFVDSKIEKE